jgi:hypothetical protein
MKQNKNKGGRPKVWTEKAAMTLLDELVTWIKKSESNFYFERFLYEEKGLYPQLISELSEQYPKFNEAIERIKKIKEAKIMDLGLKMGLSAPLVKFYMINNSNWKDKIETDNKTDITTAGSALQLNYIVPKQEDKKKDE